MGRARAILASKKNKINAIHFSIQNGIPVEEINYKSIDTVAMNKTK